MTIPSSQRSHAVQEHHWNRFLRSSSADDTHPYCDVYSKRLAHLRPHIPLPSSHSHEHITSKARILELEESVPSYVIGTVILSSEVDGDVFDNLNMAANVYLEDDSGRVALEFSSASGSPLYLITGMVCGIVGTVQERTGVMVVEEVYLAGEQVCEVLEEDVMEEEVEEEEDVYVLLVSGLECGSGNGDVSASFRRDLLVDYITGQLFADGYRKAGRIARVVVAGGSCVKFESIAKDHRAAAAAAANGSKSLSAAQKDSWKKKKVASIELRKQTLLYPIKELDESFLAPILAGGVPVDLLPGKYDPTNVNPPQQPLHASLLPHASTFGSLLNRVSNPYECSMMSMMIDDDDEEGHKKRRKRRSVRILGSDGTVIREVMREARRIDSPNSSWSSLSLSDQRDTKLDSMVCDLNEMDALQLTLQCGHIAPSSPDCTPCFPLLQLTKGDPFVIEAAKSSDRVYFMGNSNEFDTKLVRHGGDGGGKTRMICIPSFAKTSQVVLLNLNSLKCEVVEFGNDMMDFDGA
eukprot:CAMPEP_0116062952 /NCGR_PEP_ID=MMETSP0322-20121206/8096_1 /TAXON_ID=163516 /ORGANISM="Leptocylindrus danicus var. apora, Strain B651" /LENGTH=521 /DNA_ID=CAMNT_0003548419 /DNA_START=29 /DNA_END=1594 /DNA_ORIENTATION=+